MGWQLKTVDKALSLLLCFTEERPEWSVTELARECGLQKPSVSRILATLRRHGFVVQDPATRRYRVGLSLAKLGWVALGCFDLRRVSLPVMRELALATGESTFLTIVQGVEALCLEKVEGPHPVRASFEVGRHMPLHAGASAKLLLAYMPVERVELVARSRGLERFTDRTTTDLGRLRRELDEIRSRGHAFSDGELDEGVAAVAVPIFDADGDVAASLSLAGPSARVRQRELTGLVEDLCLGSRRITAALSPCEAAAAREGN